MGSHERFWSEGIIRSECVQERLSIKGGDKGTETGKKEGDGRADSVGAESWPDWMWARACGMAKITGLCDQTGGNIVLPKYVLRVSNLFHMLSEVWGL